MDIIISFLVIHLNVIGFPKVEFLFVHDYTSHINHNTYTIPQFYAFVLFLCDLVLIDFINIFHISLAVTEINVSLNNMKS